MKQKRFVLFLAILIIASLSCSLFGGGSSGSDGVAPSGGDSAPGNAPPSGGLEEGTSGNYATEFPLPADVQNYTDMGSGSINYQTSMKLNDVVAFYRDAFAKAGYEERDITTVINDTTFSIVWDGHPSGQAIVVQGVDLGNGTVNVNVRLEDV